MKIRYTILIFTFALASCQSKQTAKPVVNAVRVDSAPNALPANFKFSFYISATGSASMPTDSWTMDTTGTMVVRTSRATLRGQRQEEKGLATLDDKDMDSLRLLIRDGKLYAIDSSDLNQQCADNEYYVLRIIPLAATHYLSVGFDACAATYNLLLEPQRRYFRKFIDWWERMREKYRPG